MTNTKEKPFECSHPKDNQFKQTTNYSYKTNVDLTICRNCGVVVKEKSK